MALYFTNLYQDTIWIAFVYHDPKCRGTPFRKMGWWSVKSKTSFNAWNVTLNDVPRHAAFYAAQYTQGGATWSGKTGDWTWYPIPDRSFDRCFDDNVGCNLQPRFAPLELYGFDLFVRLGPKSEQRKLIRNLV